MSTNASLRPHCPSPQGSLTVVDPDHGATLRSNWSIDNSEELGNLEFGISLDYDAVSRGYDFPRDAGFEFCLC